MPKVLVLESFIGNKEECDKYANAHGVIPWAQHNPFARSKGAQTVIDLTSARAEELQKKKIVKILTDREYEALTNPAPLSKAVSKPVPSAIDK